MLTPNDTITIVDATKYPRSIFEHVIYNGKGNQQHDLDVRIRHLISHGDDEFLHSASATVRMDLHAFTALELTASVYLNMLKMYPTMIEILFMFLVRLRNGGILLEVISVPMVPIDGNGRFVLL
jgi:hypothetical protein